MMTRGKPGRPREVAVKYPERRWLRERRERHLQEVNQAYAKGRRDERERALWYMEIIRIGLKPL
jgi:hypothetical protein